MEEITEIFITPKQAKILDEFFTKRPFYRTLNANGLVFGWEDSEDSREWPLMTYKNRELKISLINIRNLPKKARESVLKIMAETKILEILEDLDVKI